MTLVCRKCCIQMDRIDTGETAPYVFGKYFLGSSFDKLNFRGHIYIFMVRLGSQVYMVELNNSFCFV